MSSRSENNSKDGTPTKEGTTGSKPGGPGGNQMDLQLAGREEIDQKPISLHVPLGDREALLRRTKESRDHSKPTVFLQDHLHLSLIKRIWEGTYFPRRLLLAASKPTSPVPRGAGSKDSRKDNRPLEPEAKTPKAETKAAGIPTPVPAGILSGREERTASLQLTLRGSQRTLKAVEVVNTDLARLEARVATSGSLFRWPFGRCDLKVLVRAALREIAASVRGGEPRLFSRGRGVCAKAARPHSETAPWKARLAESHFPEKGSPEEGSPEGESPGRYPAEIPTFKSQAAGDVDMGATIDAGATTGSSGEAEGLTVGLETVLSRPQGLRAGLPTGHTRVPVPLVEKAARRLESRADGEGWGPAHLVRRGIGWVASLAATDPAEALSKVQEARRLRKSLKERGAQDASDSRLGDSRKESPEQEGSADRETSSSGRPDKLFDGQEESARGALRCTLELCPTRRVALKEVIRSLSGFLDRLSQEASGPEMEDVELKDVELKDVTCAASLCAAGLLEAAEPLAPETENAYRKENTGGKDDVGEDLLVERDSPTEETPPAQPPGSPTATGQEGGGMPGPRLFEKPEGQDRSGHQVSIAITPEAEDRLGRKARRYFRKPTEVARLAIRRMARWARECPAEAFKYVQEESSLYQPPHESEKYQYAFQLYVSFEMRASVWRARRTLQKGPAAGLGRRVTRRQIYRAAARLAIESMEISAPLAE